MNKQNRKLFPIILIGLVLLTGFCLFPSVHAYAADTAIHSIDINVTLNEDGSADITEVWDITMTSGTEWYLVQGNLGKMEIQDFSVSDETGLVYEYIDGWNVNRSLEEKAGKCGILYQGDGVYELCFGIGSYGRHQFTVSYQMTNFIKGFKDYCGFNQRFVNDKLSSKVDRISVAIEKPGTVFTSDDTKVWAFGFTGNIHVIDGIVHAESESALTSSNYVTIMCRFPRDMFDTGNIINKSFSTMMKKAMKDSDYGDYHGNSSSSSDSRFTFFRLILLFAFSGICIIITVIAAFFSHQKAMHTIPDTFEASARLADKWADSKLVKKPLFWIFSVTLLSVARFLGIILIILFIVKDKKVVYVPSSERGKAYFPSRLKAEAKKNQAYYRDIPLDGNISSIYAALTFTGITTAESNILGAYLLKWLHQGNIEIRNVKKTGLKGILGAEAPSIVLLSPPESGEYLESSLYQMLSRASGDDNILQEKEMYQWSQKNYSTYKAWLMNVEADGKQSLCLSHYLSYIYQPSYFNMRLEKKDAFTAEGRQVILSLYGFQNYLKDFTLIQEREPVEVSLWNDYLITAQLFGMADQVAEVFAKMNPHHFEETCYSYDHYDLASTFLVLNTISRASTKGMRSGASAASASSYSGGGGSSSSGGGGGFSGGGSGGGGR